MYPTTVSDEMSSSSASTSSLSSKLPESASETLTFTITHNRRTETFTFDATTSHLSDLQSTLLTTFSVPPEAQKLILKGKRLPTTDSTILLATVIPAGAKVGLVGTQVSELEAMQAAEVLRDKKKKAFEYHQSHKGPAVRNTTVGGLDGNDQYKFHEIKPFPPEVPSYDARVKMLERLSTDPAVKEIMVKHKFVVGVLTELHPHLQPTLLGLNRNAGQEICLRLLTDDLTGTRAYLEVRRVLIHELTHNQFGPHDNDFKELNSLLTKQVATYETSRGLRVGQLALLEPWDPEGDDDTIDRTARRLDEVEVGPSARQRMRLTEEDEVEERRERMRQAAEERLKKGHT